MKRNASPGQCERHDKMQNIMQNAIKCTHLHHIKDFLAAVEGEAGACYDNAASSATACCPRAPTLLHAVPQRAQCAVGAVIFILKADVIRVKTYARRARTSTTNTNWMSPR